MKDEDICNDGNGKGKESEIPQESILGVVSPFADRIKQVYIAMDKTNYKERYTLAFFLLNYHTKSYNENNSSSPFQN